MKSDLENNCKWWVGQGEGEVSKFQGFKVSKASKVQG
jgi:hypothetical protein